MPPPPRTGPAALQQNPSKGPRMNFRLTLAAASLAAAALAAPVGFAALPTTSLSDSPVPSLAPMVKRTSPSVVNIATRGTIKEKPGQHNPLMDDPFFRRFFDTP